MKYEAPLRQIGDGVTVGRDSAWAWFLLGDYSRAFKLPKVVKNKFALLVREMAALTPLEYHILIVPRQFDPSDWVKGRIAMNPQSKRWRVRNEKVGEVLQQTPNWRYERYFGLRLGARPTGWEQFMGRLRAFLRRIERLWTGLENPVVSREELAHWERFVKETITKKVDGKGLNGRRATAREIRWLAQFVARPGLTDLPPSQRRTFAGTAMLPLYNVPVSNPAGKDLLRVSGPGEAAWVSTGVVTELPPELYSPGRGEWLDLRSLAVPVIVSIRGAFNAGRAVKQVKRRKKQAERQVEQELAKSGEADALWERTKGRVAELDADVREGSVALAPTTFCIKVWGRTEAELRERQDVIRKHFDPKGILVEFPVGNQLNLHIESQPGEEPIPYYELEVELPFVAAAGFTNQYGVGDDAVSSPPHEGFDLGHPIGFDGSIPVFFSSGNAGAARVKTGVLYGGEPGQGKSALLKLLMIWEYWLEQSGIVVFDLGQALEWDKVVAMLNDDDQAWAQEEKRQLDSEPRAQVMSYDPADPGNWGRLDPLYLITDREEATHGAVDLMRSMVEDVSRSERNLMVEACDHVLRSTVKPSLSKVFEHLAAQPNPDAIELARSLQASNKGIARLFVGNDETYARRPRRLFEKGTLTVIHILGLKLPDPGKLELSSAEKLSALAVEMIDRELRRHISISQGWRKILAYTEGWFILRQSNSLPAELGRTGSKLDVEIHMDTQYVEEILGDEALRNAFSTIFGFNAGDISPALAELMGVPGFAAELAVNPKYRAFVRDRLGRFGNVAIHLIFKSIAEATRTKAVRDSPEVDGPGEAEEAWKDSSPMEEVTADPGSPPRLEVVSGDEFPSEAPEPSRRGRSMARSRVRR